MGSVTFNGLRTWVKLQINDQPGKVIPLVGVLAAIAGLLCSLFIRPRRTWVRVRDEDGRTVVEVAALDRVSGGDPGTHVGRVAEALRPAGGPAAERDDERAAEPAGAEEKERE